jgi:two-component system phosphate regulon sensor histidine kinase PhoR
MERLVRDLLRLARLDAGQETPEPAPCDLRAVVQGVAGDLVDAASGRGVRIEVDVEPDLGPLVTDPARLHDVLRNLVENAINYSPDDAVVRVRAAREDGAAVIQVLDHGPGIPEQDLVRVFERFYRVDKSRSRRPGGTGIGLAIARHLTELLGGTIQAANRPEGGAVFTVRLPLEG